MRKYTEEALKETIKTVIGKPITVDFDTENTIGVVTDAWYDESIHAIRFKGKIYD